MEPSLDDLYPVEVGARRVLLLRKASKEPGRSIRIEPSLDDLYPVEVGARRVLLLRKPSKE